MQDVSGSPREDRRSGRPLRLLAGIGIAGVAALLAAFGLMRSPEERTREVAERGALVMPFELDRTTHVFRATKNGGVQTVAADDPTDGAQVRLIRGHLRKEAARFARGDFRDPRTIHGSHMPGLATLEERAHEMEVRFQETSDGARITYASGDASVVRALHAWFEAQTSDHGEHAR